MKKYGIYTPEKFTEFSQWNKRGVEDTLASIQKDIVLVMVNRLQKVDL